MTPTQTIVDDEPALCEVKVGAYSTVIIIADLKDRRIEELDIGERATCIIAPDAESARLIWAQMEEDKRASERSWRH